VGQTIVFRHLPPSVSAGRRHKPIVCPTGVMPKTKSRLKAGCGQDWPPSKSAAGR
jgi:hypothetical protein